ncbi:MAG: helix-turn-helix domain-containing protein [Spirochaetota bacterium]
MRHPHRYRAVSAEGRVLDELQLVFIAGGSGVFEDASGAARRVEAGSCFVLAPGRWHRYHPYPATGWREYWVGVRGHLAGRAIELLRVGAKGPVIRPGNDEEIAALYERLLRLAAIHDTVAHVEMAAEVLKLVAFVARGASEGDRPAPDEAVEHAIRRMRASVAGRIDVAELARDCRVSESTFRRSFRSRTGSSPYRYYMALKVNAAKRELAHSALPVKAVAETLGFTDQYHLSRVFKEYTGVSPSQWRRGRG